MNPRRKKKKPPARSSEHEGQSKLATKTLPPPLTERKAEAADAKHPDNLKRQVFTTSRSLDYFSQKELTLQTGHGPDAWPDVAVKELVDNALDATEEAGLRPEIILTITPKSLAVSDNGPGIAPDVIKRICDFDTRTSSKDFYVSPTRGAQGNALKTLLAMPYVLSGSNTGTVEIESKGVHTAITVTVDHIHQQPRISSEQRPSDVKSGTSVQINWPELASLLAHPIDYLSGCFEHGQYFIPSVVLISFLRDESSDSVLRSLSLQFWWES